MDLQDTKYKQGRVDEKLVTPKNMGSTWEDLPTKEQRFKDRSEGYDVFDSRHIL